LINPLLGLTDCLIIEGRVAESEAYIREAIGLERKLTQDQRTHLPQADYTGRLLEKIGDFAEAEVWYRQALSDETKYPRLGPNQYAQALINLVTIHFPQEKFHQLEISYPEWLQQARGRLPPGDPNLAEILAQVVTAPLFEQNWEEAENLARECLTIREKKLPNDWRTYEARSILGNCLFHQKRYTEAEPLLLSAGDGLKQHTTDIPDAWRPRVSADLKCVVQFYEATGCSNQVAEWKQTLQEFEQAQTNRPPSAKPSP
jgi:tetratricopeptide (TPR) repeat protein